MCACKTPLTSERLVEKCRLRAQPPEPSDGAPWTRHAVRWPRHNVRMRGASRADIICTHTRAPAQHKPKLTMAPPLWHTRSRGGHARQCTAVGCTRQGATANRSEGPGLRAHGNTTSAPSNGPLHIKQKCNVARIVFARIYCDCGHKECLVRETVHSKMPPMQRHKIACARGQTPGVNGPGRAPPSTCRATAQNVAGVKHWAMSVCWAPAARAPRRCTCGARWDWP